MPSLPIHPSSTEEDLGHPHVFNPTPAALSLHFQPLPSPKPFTHLMTTGSIFILLSHLNQRLGRGGRKTKNYIVTFPPKLKCLPPSLPYPVTAPPPGKKGESRLSSDFVPLTLLIKVARKFFKLLLTVSCISLPSLDSHGPPNVTPAFIFSCRDSFDHLRTGLSPTEQASNIHIYRAAE